jgi:hypothetical protein
MRKATDAKSTVDDLIERNHDIYEEALEQIVKLGAVPAMLRALDRGAGCALKEVTLTPEDLGNIGWLLEDGLDQIKSTLDKIDLRSPLNK